MKMRILLRGGVVFAIVIASLLSLSTQASALSIQIRGGGGFFNGPSSAEAGIDLIYYEGKTFDLFISGDHLESQSKGHIDPKTDYTWDMNTLDMGFRYKMQTSSAWKPYMAIALWTGKPNFKFAQGGESLFRSNEGGNTSWRAGGGVDISVSESISLGMEAIYRSDIPGYDTSKRNSSGVYQISNEGHQMTLDLGLRYHF